MTAVGHFGVFVDLAREECNAHLVVLLATTGGECHRLLQCHGHCEYVRSVVVMMWKLMLVSSAISLSGWRDESGL
jgi:hypothetical protein